MNRDCKVIAITGGDEHEHERLVLATIRDYLCKYPGEKIKISYREDRVLISADINTAIDEISIKEAHHR